MENNKKLIEVVAALIWRGEKFMICQRPANKARGLLWEFVGGKVEQGESLAQALVRECREELAITIQPSEIFAQLTHEYPDVIVHLTIFNATIKEGEPQLLEHNDLKWITKEQIPNFTFCPADEEILGKIANLK
jgi:8-oxo-dGTP diphosphatase